MNAPPNVLYLHSHDTGRHVSPYGFAVDTPALQGLADRGVTFRQGFCANPTCSPSRACLLSGRWAHSNGMMGLAHFGGRLAEPGHTLPAVLRGHGYDTVLAGIQHVAADASEAAMAEVGYTGVLPSATPSADHAARDAAVAAGAAAFLRGRGPDAAPFFLDCGFFLTHRTPVPGQPQSEQWHNADASPLGDPRRVAVPACLPDTPEVRADVADFEAAVGRLDGHVGVVLDALSAAGLAESTLVVATTDHGPAFPRMKCELTHHGTGVMLILAGPGGFRGGLAVDALASHVDLFPTVCEALGIEPPAWLQGRTLTPALAAPGDPTAVRDAVFAEVNHHAAFEPKRSVRTPRHAYTRRLNPDRPPHPVWPNTDDSPTKTHLHAEGSLHAAEPEEELFDLYADPQESCNLAADPAHANTLADLRGRLDAWMRETDDPGLHGPPRVAGMRATPDTAYSPE